MANWVDITLDKKLFKNIDESALTSTFGALENCYVTESNGISRFPGLKSFCEIGGNGEIHMSKYQNDMVAVSTDGKTFRVNNSGGKAHIGGTPVLGGKRTSFARTRDGLMMAAGAQIIKYDGEKNSVLSPDAPLSQFIGFLDGYVLAVERESGRFQYSELNKFSSWPALSTEAVDGSPDDINSMLITPFNEILFGGYESIEQFERLPGGETPFFRRWSTGDGIVEPWTLCHADNAAWGLNSKYEFVRLSGQTSQSASDDIQGAIEKTFAMSGLQNLNQCWAAPLYIKGQKFIVFQAPKASNAYGTEGFTAVFDIRRGQWFEIFGWNEELGVPTLWPGRSVFTMWGRTFIGGVGKIYEISPDVFNNDGQTQRAYMRTAHFDTLGTMRVDGVRLTIKRGVGSYTQNPKIMFRTNPDDKGFGNWQTRELGLTGNQEMVIEFGGQGVADTWQIEISVTDDCQFELRRLQFNVSKVMR